MQAFNIDSIDLMMLQNIYVDINMKTTCYELKIGHSTYSRRIKKLLNSLGLEDIQQLRKWIVKNFDN